MPDDPYYPDDPYNDGHDDPYEGYSSQEPADEAPASAIFAEMMRRAAETSYQLPPDERVSLEQNPQHYSSYTGGQVAQSPDVQPTLTDEVVRRPSPGTTGTIVNQQDEHAAQREAYRVRRIQRRKARRRKRTVGLIGGFLQTLIIVLVAAGIMATIFAWFTDADFLNPQTRQGLEVAIATSQATTQPTAQVTPNWLRRIGIVSGHRGPEIPPDPGAVCPDGLTEAEINFNVAQLVVRNLRAQGYTVDLMDEFDPRLDGYEAAALISIHANTCQEWPGEIVSGFLVAKAAARPEGGADTQLAECVGLHYGQATGLNRRFNLTVDMTDYHSFREIHPRTPAAIIELGFMLADRALLTEQPALLARGITDGIICFLEPGAPRDAAITPTP